MTDESLTQELLIVQVNGGENSEQEQQEHEEEEEQEQEQEQRRREKMANNHNGRLISIDMMRGFIMMLMAWDHTKDILVSSKDQPHAGMEDWWGPFASYDNSTKLFLARTVSHICAPGFFFSMGISMVLFALNRMTKHHWDYSKIIKHYLIRGLIIAFVFQRLNNLFFEAGFLVDNLRGRHFSNNNPYVVEEDTFFETLIAILFRGEGVLLSLGLNMMIIPALFLVPMSKANQKWPVSSQTRDKNFLPILGTPEILGFVFFFMIHFISLFAIDYVQHGDVEYAHNRFPASNVSISNFGELVERTVLFPGQITHYFGRLGYPLLPWMGTAVLGLGFGFSFSRDAANAHRLSLFTSLFFLVFFFMDRSFLGKFGNERGLPRHDTGASKWILFFGTTKYPPDLAYSTITLSVDTMLIYVFSFEYFQIASLAQKEKRFHWTKPFLVFGQNPMIYYLLHLCILGSIRMCFQAPVNNYDGLLLEQCVVVWILLLCVLYPICLKFGEFKSQTSPESLWRIL